MDKVTIDGETADGIARASIKESMQYLITDIAKLKRNKKRAAYQTEELLDNVALLDAFKKVYTYYGGNLK